MDRELDEGDAIIFMKIGSHANESLADIIARKKREVEDAGFAMWGYGGNTCHPTTMVQPFARANRDLSRRILLCMQPMDSRHFADQIPAEEYSIDGLRWMPIPHGIKVLGSRYALCVKGLREVDTSLPLGDTRVAIGNSKGKVGSDYIRGRVDKACLEVVGQANDSFTMAPIGVMGEIIDPFAVLLRN